MAIACQNLILLGLALLFVTLGGCVSNMVSTTPPPSTIAPSPLYSVKVNGRPVFVYPCSVTRIVGPDGKLLADRHQTSATIPAAFTTFDFTGKIEVEVQVHPPALNAPLKTVTVRPLRHAIVPTIDGDVARFTIDTPGQYAIEPNCQLIAPLHLFANAPETSRPDPADPRVKYFGPGEHTLGMFHVPSDTTVYIAAGAVVRGHIYGDNVSNVKVLGRGILDASKSPVEGSPGTPGPLTNEFGIAGRHMRWFKCKDITVDGIILLDSPSWGIEVTHCDRVNVHNVKVITGRGADGIDICSSEDVNVDGCFFRTHDDSINIKGLTELGYPGGSNGKQWSPDGVRKAAARITFSRCVIWNDRAHALMIGPETRATEIRDILYRDIDVVHALSVHALAIFSGDSAPITNVRYENINLEDPTVMELMGIRVGPTYVTADEQRGPVRDVHYKNIHVMHPGSHSTAFAENEVGCVANVTYENIRFGDKRVTTPEEMLLHTRGPVSGIQVK